MSSRTPPIRAVVLLSGGLDSTTVLALATAAGRQVHALSFRYGQRHALELACAARQAARMEVRAHEVVDLGHVGRLVASATSLVQGSPLDVPKDATPGAGAIPSTYVPARNTLFLAYALAWPRPSTRARSGSASTRSTTPVTPTVAPSSSPRFKSSPTSPPAPASRAARSGSRPRCCT